MPDHGIVVVGASAGGVEALAELAASLPSDLPAAVLVVLHLPATGTSALPEILRRHGPLPAAHVQDGEPIQPGRIYVGPPDHHVLLRTGHVHLPAGRGRMATGLPSTRCSAAPPASTRPG
jgi:two-component system chemotaxis response regulator CheB